MKKILMITLVGFFLIVGLYVGATFISEQPIINIFGGDAPNTFGFSEEVNWGSGDLLTDLVGYWKLDNTTGVIYDMTTDYDGVNNGATRGAAGIINDGVYFNSAGTDYIHNFGMPLPTGNFSVSGWFNSTDITGYHYMISQSTSTAGHWRIAMLTDDDNIYIVQHRGATANSATGSISLSENTWYHFVMVSDESGFRGYVNGVEDINEVNSNVFTRTANQGLTFGAGIFNVAVQPNRWDGNIDEVGIWNRSLTEEEILALYNEGVGDSYPFSGGGTITLNSPADDSIATSPEVTFNATANITSGSANITNISLWTNQTGSWERKQNVSLIGGVQNNLGDNTILDSSEVSTTSTSYVLEKTLFVSGRVINGTNEIRKGAIGGNPVAYCKMVFNYEDLTSAEVEETEATTSYAEKTYINPNPEKIVSTIEVYIRRESGDAGISVFEKNTQINGDYPIQTFTETGLSGTFDWNVEACDTDGDCGFAGSNFTLSIDAEDPNVTIFDPIGTYNYSEVGDTQILNFTAVNGGSLEDCWYDYNGTDVIIGCSPIPREPAEFDTGATYVVSGTQSGYTGVAINVSDFDITLYSFSKSSLSGVTGVGRVGTTPNGFEVTTCTWVGNTCTPASPVNLSANTNYYITGAGGDFAWNSSVTFTQPSDDEFLWYGRVDQAGGLAINQVATIETLNISSSEGDLPVITLEPNNFNLTIYANDSAGNEGSNFTSWEYKAFLNTLTFPNLTTEGNIDDFTYAIKTGTGLSVATANFYYNGTSSSASVNSLGDNLYNLTISQVAPTLTSDANFTFFMQINLDDGFSVNTSSNNQTVLNVGLDNCSTNTVAILNYTLVDEDTQIPLVPADNGTIEIDLALYSTDGSLLITTFNETFSETNNASVCISDDALNDSSYSLYSTARYTGVDYSEEYSHIQNLTLDNESGTEEVTLFDLLTARSTDFLITFKDANFLPVADAIIQVERQYVGEGVFKSVEAPLTSSEGQTVAHLIRNDMIYNFVVLKNGIILGTFNNLVAFCDDIVTENCNIQLNLLAGSGQIYDYDSAVGIAYDLSYNETTRVLSVPFTTTSGDPANVSIYAVKFDQLGETEACSTALVSASATLTCTIPVALSNESISYVISVDSVPTLQGFFSLGSPLELGDAGYFLLLIIVISLALMFVESKTMTIIAVMLGFITSSMFYFIKGGILGPATAITWLIISGLILIYQLNSTGRT